MKNFCRAIAFLLMAMPAWVAGEELLGAKKALELIAEKSRKGTSKPEESREQIKAYEARLKAFEGQAKQLSSDDQAKGWLELFDQWGQLKNQLVIRPEYSESEDYSFSTSTGDSWESLVSVIPGPGAWDALAKQIDARPIPEELKAKIAAYGLRILGAQLTGEEAKVNQELETLERILNPESEKKAKGQTSFLGQFFLGTGGGSSQDYHIDKAKQAINSLKRQMVGGDPVEVFQTELLGATSEDSHYIPVPDLVQLAGKEKAAELIQKGLTAKNVHLVFDPQHEETFSLGRELALKNLDSLKNMPWSLCLADGDAPLYETFQSRQGKKGPDENDYQAQDEYQKATSYYLRGLVLRQEYTKGLDVLRRYGSDEERNSVSIVFYYWREMPETNRLRGNLYEFLSKVLESNPELRLWDELASYGQAAGKKIEVLKLMDAVLEQSELNSATKQMVERSKADAHLAFGDIDAAMKLYSRMLKEIAEGKEPPSSDDFGLAIKVAEIGVLLDQKERIEEGLLAFETLFARSSKVQDASFGRRYSDGMKFEIASYVGMLLERGQLAKAEQFLIDLEAKDNSGSGNRFSINSGNPGAMLAELYLKAGRFADVIALLDGLPSWGGADLEDYISWEQSSSSLGVTACKAFQETGKRELARKIAERLVVLDAGKDSGWELLLELAGDDFPKIAERVFQRDQFEERPLIWLASYQLKKGQVEEAETTIKKAISIDPSDGEQGKGDRMRAYAVLAQILEAKKDPQAEVFRGAVKAIRLAEEADQFRTLGLDSRAIEMYQESLTHFADAYCIQSRLAVQLAAAGDLEGATKHYQRAFELMPDSFGRVESHCFGCEGVFEGELASSIAKKVFDQLATERPDDPKVHYLAGYLAESQKDYELALAEYTRATKLDPDYLNAWVHLQGLKSNASIPQRILDDAHLNVYRLAPLRSEGRSGLNSVLDMKRLWETAQEVSQRIPPEEFPPLYQLYGTEEQKKQHIKFQQMVGKWGPFKSFSAKSTSTAGELLAENDFVKSALELITLVME